MNKISDFLAGVKVLEVVDSPVNGKLTVIKSLAFGTYIQAGGLTQSGGIIKNIWNTALKKVKSEKFKVKSCLVLGLGGGSIVEVIKKYWPGAKITAVDIDPLMLELGRKYLGLNDKEVEIVISDAEKYLTKKQKNLKTKKPDLILIDLYNGDEYPEKFENDDFVKNVIETLADKGAAVFNRLYYGDKRPKAVKFLSKLEKVFAEVDVVYPEANIMFVCSK